MGLTSEMQGSGGVDDGPAETLAADGGLGPGQLEVVLRGGRPWGFTLQGGAEVDSPLTIAKVGTCFLSYIAL